MKTFCFTVDDNIRFLKEISERKPKSIFDHPYLAMLRRLHERFELKIQLNLFWETDAFNLSKMSDRYTAEFSSVSDWLKLSFHSRMENVSPYENSGYDEVFADCRAVNEQILRFASPNSLAKTTTVHYCKTTGEGLRALRDNGIRGLLGLFGTADAPLTSYGICEKSALDIRSGHTVSLDGIAFASIDMIVNKVKSGDISRALCELLSRDSIRVMIHEQYFYEDYRAYQPDFEEKLETVFEILTENGYKSCFYKELI